MGYIILIIITIIITAIITSRIINSKVDSKVYEEIMRVHKDDLDTDLEVYKQQRLAEIKQEEEQLKSQYAQQISSQQSQLTLITNQFMQIQQAEATAREGIDERIKQYEEKEKEKIQKILRLEEDRLKDALDLEIQNYTLDCESKKLEIEQDLLLIQATFDDFKIRQAAINAEVLRRKEIEEQEDFYKINISKNDQEDIQVLQPIRLQLHNREAFDKLIYDVFIKRPADEMIKRVLGGGSPSGIYKITYIQTGEFYIGRSTNIKTRWGDHIKTACGLKGCAHSTIHTMMEKYGIWNFTFEVIEECDKDQLSEKEKFYIDLYGADNLINMKAGG